MLKKVIEEIQTALEALSGRINEGADPVEEKQQESPEKKKRSFFGTLASAVKKAANRAIRLVKHESDPEVERLTSTFSEPGLFPNLFRFHL